MQTIALQGAFPLDDGLGAARFRSVVQDLLRSFFYAREAVDEFAEFIK